MLHIKIGTTSLFNEFAELVAQATEPCLENVLTIDFETDEDAHNDKLQTSAADIGNGLCDFLVSKARKSWGKPDYWLVGPESISEVGWLEEAIPLNADVIIGWNREPDKVACIVLTKEDREFPLELWFAVAIRPGGRSLARTKPPTKPKKRKRKEK